MFVRRIIVASPDREPQMPDRQEVVIKDIEMSFGSMVVFMIKWTIAAIPAFIVLTVVAVVAVGFLRAMIFGK